MRKNNLLIIYFPTKSTVMHYIHALVPGYITKVTGMQYTNIIPIEADVGRLLRRQIPTDWPPFRTNFLKILDGEVNEVENEGR